LQDWKHLSNASSLCGACTEACPVKIDLHHHLLQNRRNASAREPAFFEKLAYQIFGIVANEPIFWSLAKKIGWLTQPLQRAVKGSALDPAKAWTKTRDLPPQPLESFKDWWRNRK
jgi:L-lactate dehydrogenase complex protein LldF